MRKAIMYNKVEDYLRDDDFIRYALDGCSEYEQHWEECGRSKIDSISTAFNKAIHILQNLDNCTLLNDEEIAILKSRIFKTLKHFGTQN